jgi:hypothetical protein
MEDNVSLKHYFTLFLGLPSSFIPITFRWKHFQDNFQSMEGEDS